MFLFPLPQQMAPPSLGLITGPFPVTVCSILASTKRHSKSILLVTTILWLFMAHERFLSISPIRLALQSQTDKALERSMSMNLRFASFTPELAVAHRLSRFLIVQSRDLLGT